MCVIRWFLLKSCIFGMYISVTEASVTLRTFDREETYLKDTPVTLVCTITPYNNEMTWYVDNDPYADCFLGTCGPSPNKPYTFTFDFDETAGVFNLTINSVNFAHAKLSFACDDGNVRETISFNVTTDKGQNNSSNTINSPTKPDINNQITVTNEGNEDNDVSELSKGEIVGIVLGCVFGTAFICTVVILPVYLRHRRDQRAAAAAAAAAQHQAQQAEQRRMDQRAAAAQHQEQQAEQRRVEQSVDIKAKIEVWMNEPGNCCIIMKGLLRIGELSEKIVKQTKIMFSSPLQAQPDNFRLPNIHHNRAQPDNPRLPNNHHNRAQPHNSRLRHIYHIRDVNQLYEENEIDQMRESIRREQQEGACDAHIKKGLVESATISSFVMRGFSEEFFDYMILRLQQNTDIYQKIEADIQKNEIANDDQMRIEH